MAAAASSKSATSLKEDMPDWPEEDIFGNAKKLAFIIDEIHSFRSRAGRPVRVLDFGCGNGTAVGRFLVRTGVAYTGVDFHEPSLVYAQTHFGGQDAVFLAEVPPDAVYDVIVYADVLEHLPDPLGILSAHVRQLAQDGIVIGSVPNGYGPCEVEKFIDRHLRLYRMLRFVKRLVLVIMGRQSLRPEPLPYNSGSGHVVFFTLRQLQHMVAAAGLQIRRFAHGGFVGADLTANTIFRSRRFIAWNVKVADRLPSQIVSTWYFVLSRR